MLGQIAYNLLDNAVCFGWGISARSRRHGNFLRGNYLSESALPLAGAVLLIEPGSVTYVAGSVRCKRGFEAIAQWT